MDKVLAAIDKVINILESKLNLSTKQYVVIDELKNKELFRGSWDECIEYVDEHTPDESNIEEFKFNIIESE